jgi:transketolase
MTTEDVAAVRALPHMAFLSPGDRAEMTYCMEAAFAGAGPVYVRMGKSDMGDVHPSAVRAPLGSLLPVVEGPHGVAVIATGSLLKPCADIARRLGGIEVWSAPAIKPLDEAQVAAICARARVVVTAEEHSVHGGLGGAIAEIATATNPVRIVRLGIRDRFTECCGTYAHLMRVHGLDPASLEASLRELSASAGRLRIA